jgi:hypothetical protein
MYLELTSDAGCWVDIYMADEIQLITPRHGSSTVKTTNPTAPGLLNRVYPQQYITTTHYTIPRCLALMALQH